MSRFIDRVAEITNGKKTYAGGIVLMLAALALVTLALLSRTRSTAESVVLAAALFGQGLTVVGFRHFVEGAVQYLAMAGGTIEDEEPAREQDHRIDSIHEQAALRPASIEEILMAQRRV